MKAHKHNTHIHTYIYFFVFVLFDSNITQWPMIYFGLSLLPHSYILMVWRIRSCGGRNRGSDGTFWSPHSVRRGICMIESCWRPFHYDQPWLGWWLLILVPNQDPDWAPFSCHHIVCSQPPWANYTFSGCRRQRHVQFPRVMKVYVVSTTRFVDVAPRL